MKTLFLKPRGWLAGAGLLCAVSSWGEPVPTGVMSEYFVHCQYWVTYSAEACGRLADRLAAVETPTPAERLALLNARGRMARRAGREADDCPGLAAIAADYPDFAYALYFLSFCVPWHAPGDGGESPAVALLKRAVEIEPDNYLALSQLLYMFEGMHPVAGRMPPGWKGRRGTPDADPGALATWREALYEAGMARAVWWRAALENAEPDDPPGDDLKQGMIWEGPLEAGRRIYAAALREGDRHAAEAIQARLRRDLGLDALDYGAESARASLALACQPELQGGLGLEDVCLSGVERVAGRASADGLPLPGYVLKEVDYAAYLLRRAACAANMGVINAPGMMQAGPECHPEATETPAVRRLRAVLEHHGGPRSAEHHRVLAQQFLGGHARIEGLRAALRADAGNARARCELATALDARGDSAGVAALGDVDPECVNRADFAWGDIDATHRGVP